MRLKEVRHLINDRRSEKYYMSLSNVTVYSLSLCLYFIEILKENNWDSSLVIHTISDLSAVWIFFSYFDIAERFIDFFSSLRIKSEHIPSIIHFARRQDEQHRRVSLVISQVPLNKQSKTRYKNKSFVEMRKMSNRNDAREDDNHFDGRMFYMVDKKVHHS